MIGHLAGLPLLRRRRDRALDGRRVSARSGSSRCRSARATRPTTDGAPPTSARTRATSICSSSSSSATCSMRYGRVLLQSSHWLQRRTKYERPRRTSVLLPALESVKACDGERRHVRRVCCRAAPRSPARLARLRGRREARNTSRRSRTCSIRATTARTAEPRCPGNTRPSAAASWCRWARTSARIKISGWTHTIPEYFDFDRFWAGYPGARDAEGGPRRRLRAGGCQAAHRRAARPGVGHAPSLSHQLAGDRRRRPRQPGAARIRSRPTTCCSCTTASRWAWTRPRRS